MAQLLLLDYQETWPALYQEVAVELLAVFAPSGAAVEHIGSTAVPGLCAKPVLDVLVGLDRLGDAEACRSRLAALGYVYRPDYEAHLPERRYFVRAEGRIPRVHVHCVVRGSRLWQQHMAFRDVLRRCPEVLAEYAALKRRLAVAYAGDKQGYTDAKAPFVERVIAGAVGAD